MHTSLTGNTPNLCESLSLREFSVVCRFVRACFALTSSTLSLLALPDLHKYLAHKKTPAPLERPSDPRYRPTVGSYGGAIFLSEVPL